MLNIAFIFQKLQLTLAIESIKFHWLYLFIIEIAKIPLLKRK